MNPDTFERHVRVAFYCRLEREKQERDAFESRFAELLMWRMFDGSFGC